MGDVSRIDVKLDRKSFDIVLGTFSFMHDNYYNPSIIDPAALMISHQEIADMIQTLKSSDTGDDEIAIPMNFHDWVVYCALLEHTSGKIPQADPDAYDVLEALFEECGRLDDAGVAPRGPEASKAVRTLMWQELSEIEKNSIAAQIDAQDPFNRYGANALGIMRIGLSFFPGAQLLRVGNRSPAVGNRYFIQKGSELIPLHRLVDIQTYCDNHFGVRLEPGTALDYFRFAHFFSDEGQNTSLVEGPQDLRINPPSSDPAEKQAIAFIQPPEVKTKESGLTVTACTFAEAERESRLYRDSYRLTPGQPLQLLSRKDSGVNLRHPFLDKQLKIGRSDSAF
jgi:hypothetical protein